MDPLFKKYLELFISISILFTIFWFLLYMTYFNSLCNKYSWDREVSLGGAILKLSKCNDSLVCEVKWMVSKDNKPYHWNCNKKQFLPFEWKFYIEKINRVLWEYWN